MEVNRSKFIIYFISCFLFTRFRKDFRFFFCPRGTGSSFERFEFARYLSPFNGSLREWRGFDRSVCETGTNMSRVWQEILFPRFAKCLGHHKVREGLNGRSLLKEPSFGHNPRDHPVDGV